MFNGSYLATVDEAALEQGSVADAVRGLRGDADQVREAMAAIDAAAARRDPDALERQALFEALGYRRPQDWMGALDRLAQAAGLGSRSAQRQLLILAGGASDTAARAPDWKIIRDQISIENLSRVSDKESLCEAPRVRIMRGLAKPAECAWLIQRARDRLQPAVVVTDSGSETIETARTNRAIEFQVADMDLSSKRSGCGSVSRPGFLSRCSNQARCSTMQSVSSSSRTTISTPAIPATPSS